GCCFPMWSSNRRWSMFQAEAAADRPEIFREPVSAGEFGVVQKPLTRWERAYGNGALRKTLLLLVCALIWEAYARQLGNPLLVPTVTDTALAMRDGIASGDLQGRAWYSIKVLLGGYGAGLALAAVLTMLAITSRVGTDILETFTSMFNPLPSIALLPLALI